MRKLICFAAAIFWLVAGQASAVDAAPHKDGFWMVGRDDAEAKGCIASIEAHDGNSLMVQVAPGHWDVVIAVGKRMPTGRRGVLTIDDKRFQFRPEYTDSREILFLEDPGGRAFDAMRHARDVLVEVDGREILRANLAATGANEAFDAAVACSKGESGWWGPGVGAPAPKPPVNKENVWFLERSEIGLTQVCTAYALADDRTMLIFIGAAGLVGVAVKSDDEMRRSGKGMVEADGRRIAIKPIFDGKRYFASDQSIDGEDLEAIRNAENLRISVADRVVVDAKVGGSGLRALLDDLVTCSKGAKGWWGEGARQP